MSDGEPAGDPLQRLAVRAAGLGLLGALLPLTRLQWAGSIVPLDPQAHARAMALGFLGVFVCGFLFRILPRTRRGSLPGAPLARVGVLALPAVALADGAGLTHPGWLAAGYGVGGLLVAIPLARCWFSPRRTTVWFGGWLAAGLLGMALGWLGLWGGLLFSPGVAGRAPTAFLVAGVVPLTLGLAVRMLPPMSGIGPNDRGRAQRIGERAPPLAVAASVLLLSGRAVLAPAAALGLLILAGGAVASLNGLKLRGDGEPDRRDARREAAPTLLRWTARVAFGFLAAGLALLAIRPAGPESWSAGVHAIGVGFLCALALGVGQRIVPGFVRSEVRWPRVRALSGLLLLFAVVARLLAEVDPRWLPAGGLALAGAWVVFALQIGPTLRAPRAADPACGCPRPTPPA